MMKRDLAKMPHPERMRSIMDDMLSPVAVEKADEVVALIEKELKEARSIRDLVAERHGIPKLARPAFDAIPAAEVGQSDPSGDVESLVAMYRTDERSGYQNLKFNTRRFYDNLIKRILADCGDKKLIELSSPDIQRLYDAWGEEGKKAPVAHALVTMLRTLANYGAKTLGDESAERLAMVIHKMQFTPPKRKSEQLKKEQAVSIRHQLRRVGYGSIALAQALQFDLFLRQSDVIGEWVPLSEPGSSDVFSQNGREKWVRGLRWDQVDENLLLRYSGDDGEVISFDLNRAQMVMEEIHIMGRRDSGPMIIREGTGLPWNANEFRRQWRKAADACGIPKVIKNMSSRLKSEQDKHSGRLREPDQSKEEETPSVRPIH